MGFDPVRNDCCNLPAEPEAHPLEEEENLGEHKWIVAGEVEGCRLAVVLSQVVAEIDRIQFEMHMDRKTQNVLHANLHLRTDHVQLCKEHMNLFLICHLQEV